MSACDVTLARGLTRHEAEAASVQLNQHGIAVGTSSDAQQLERFQLEVAESAVPQALEVLAARSPSLPDDALASRARRDLPLVPTRSAELRAREEALADKLQRRVRSIPGVAESAVQVAIAPMRETLEDLSAVPQPPAIKLEVHIVRDPEAPALGERIRALIASSDPELARATLALDERAWPRVSSACTKLSHLGPITLTTASMRTLKLWLAASLLVHMLSAAGLIALVRRSQRLRVMKANRQGAEERQAET